MTRTTRWLIQLAQDLRYAVRQLRHAPGFTLSILLVLGLGIGANAAIFGVLNATLLRRLPFDRPEQLVSLRPVDAKGNRAWSSFPDIPAWQQQSRTVAAIAYYDAGSAYLDIPGGQELVSVTKASANLFATLGVAPALGRSFTEQEQQPGKGDVVVLSDAVWRSQFHADPAILGRTVPVDGAPATVIGVMPRNFAFPVGDTKAQIWRPIEITPQINARTLASESYDTIARLRAGVTTAAAQADLSAVQRRLRPLYTGRAMLAASAVQVASYRDALDHEDRPALLALLAAVGLIWLIACANAANLMLARGSARRREMAVRGALGASRARIVRQLLTESLLLSLGSAVVGLALGAATLRLFAHAMLTQLHLARVPAFDPRVLVALLGLTLLSTLLFGLVLALLATNLPLEQALRQDGAKTGAGRSRNRLQSAMVVTEIALSLTLLVACGLLLRTVFALRKVPLGFRTDHVVLVEPNLPGYKYRGANMQQVLYLPLLERIRSMHGVQAAGLTSVVPLDHRFATSIQMMMWKSTASSTPSSPTRIDVRMRVSTAGLQQVFGLRVKQGRYFDEQDTLTSQPVMLVNEAFARQYQSIQGTSILGNFSMGLSKGRSAKVIGIVEDYRQVGVDQAPAPEMAFLASQLQPGDNFFQDASQSHIELAIRTSVAPDAFLPDLRSVLVAANPDLRGATIATMDQVVEDSIGSQILATHLLETFGGLALLVALAGLYSLLAYLVTLRSRELGVRLALGADRTNIQQLILGQAAKMVVVGVVIGGAVSLATAHLLRHFLFGVAPRDPVTMIAAIALMAIVSLLAAWLPARRAASIDPIEALRTE
jgi:predicted permease